MTKFYIGAKHSNGSIVVRRYIDKKDIQELKREGYLVFVGPYAFSDLSSAVTVFTKALEIYDQPRHVRTTED